MTYSNRSRLVIAFRAFGWLLCPGIAIMSWSALGQLTKNYEWVVSIHGGSITFLWMFLSVGLALPWMVVASIALWFRRKQPGIKHDSMTLIAVVSLTALGFVLTSKAGL